MGDHFDGEIGRDAGERRRRLRRREDERLVVAATLMQPLPAQDCVERRADAEDVGAAVDAFSETHRLLGRHERRRAERRAGTRLVAPRLAYTRDAEVEELHHVLLRNEDVRGLDVAVDDADLVERLQRVERLARDVERIGHGHLSAHAFPHLLERLAFEELHDEKRLFLIRDVVVEDRNAPRMIDAVRYVAFAEESIANTDVAREFRMEDLQRDTRAVAVGGAKHGRHTADAQHRVESILCC